MANVRIVADTLTIDITGLDKIWALKHRLTFPLNAVRGATADAGILRQPKGLRLPGTHVPGLITAGTFRDDGERVFWDVHDASKAVVIELDGKRYARVVVQVPDPRRTVAMIEAVQR